MEQPPSEGSVKRKSMADNEKQDLPEAAADFIDSSFNGCSSSTDSKQVSPSCADEVESESVSPANNPDIDPLVNDDIPLFPPLPRPNVELKRREMTSGVSLVFLLIATFVGLTHGVALTAVDAFEKYGAEWWSFLILIYTSASAAMIVLLLLMTSDPGIVHRTPETCFPIPLPAQVWVESYVKRRKEGKEPKADYDDDSILSLRPTELYLVSPEDVCSGDSYCVRCLVWRRNMDGETNYSKYFHCNTCQRCVRNFDHHCSVFGRCIAGGGSSKGNILYFWALIASGSLGFMVTAVALIWSLCVRYNPIVVVPVSVVVLWAIQCQTAARGNPFSICMACRKIAVALVDFVSPATRASSHS